MKHTYLVIDQGGHGTRSIVFDAHGNTLASAHSPVVTNNPRLGWFEQESASVATSIHDCLQQLEKCLLTKNLQPESAILITQRSSLVACTRDTLQALTPVISWQDTRNHSWLQEKIDRLELNPHQLRQLTGLQLNAHYGASKMRWLLDNDSAVRDAAQKNNLVFMPLAAYVSHLLGKQMCAVVDAATASRTYLVEFGQLEWSPTLLNLFSISAAYLPVIAASKHDFGSITLAGRNIPLCAMGGDQSFLPFAYGKTAWANSLFINAGTGAFVQSVMSKNETPSSLLCSLAAVDQHQQLTVAEGTVNACSSALDWLWHQEQQILSIDAIENALNENLFPPVFYHRITALGSPYWLPAAQSNFSEPATLEQKTVAVVESIVFLLAINIDLLQIARSGLQQILISGGMAQSDGFCRKLANCTRLPVIRHRDHEASARGAAFYLAVIDRYTPRQEPALFKPEVDQALLARYQSFYEWLRNEWMKHHS